jgi:hypothetical protein
MKLFTQRQDNWETAVKAFSTFANGGLFEEQEHPVFFTTEIQVDSHKKVGTKISFYELEGKQWNLTTPYKQLFVNYKEKIFDGENVDVNAILPLADQPYQYLLLGYCTERKWDPISIFRLIISAGHAGFAKRPLLAEMENGKVVSYHKWPRNFESNEVMGLSQPFLLGDECYLVGTSHKEYMDSLMKIECASFNLKTKKMTKPVVVYRETRKGDYEYTLSGGPVILATETQVMVTWSSRRDDCLGAGVFIRTRTNDTWGETKKISATGDSPLLVKSSNGVPFVFWHEAGKGLLYSSEKEGQWEPPCLIVEEKSLTAYFGLRWNIKSDKDGNFHIVYMRPTLDAVNKIAQNYEVVYMLLQKN